MAVINPVGHLHNVATNTALVDRLNGGASLLTPSAAGALRSAGGVRQPGDLWVSAQGTPNMSVQVAAGICFVPGQTVVAGSYTFPNDGPVTVAISAAHATLPRRDLVVARVQDSFYAGANNLGDIFVITGTAAASPTDPALPAGAAYLILARVAVGAAVTSITSGNITNLAAPVETALQYFKCTSTTRPNSQNLYDGFSIYETDTRAQGYWNVASSSWLMFDTIWQESTNPGSNTPQVHGTLGGINRLRYMRRGKRVSLDWNLRLGTTSIGAPNGANPWVLALPAGLVTAADNPQWLPIFVMGQPGYDAWGYASIAASGSSFGLYTATSFQTFTPLANAAPDWLGAGNANARRGITLKGEIDIV